MTTRQKALNAGAVITERLVGGIANPQYLIEARFIGAPGVIVVNDPDYERAQSRMDAEIVRQTPIDVLNPDLS